jgi:hypothetical protein
LVELGGIDGTLEGFVATPEVTAYRVDDRGQYRAVVTGNTFQLRNLPAGEYRLSATSPVESDYASVTVAPGATQKVTLRKREVGVIVGTVVDEKSHTPLERLYCTSSLRGDSRSSESGYAATDASGAFRIERAAVGINDVRCGGSAASATGEANVAAGQVTRLDLAASVYKAPQQGYAGLTLEDQLGEVMVKSIEPGGPAARAGVAVGDVLLEVDDSAVGRWEGGGVLSRIEYRAIGTQAKLTLERGEKQLTVLLTIEAPK